MIATSAAMIVVRIGTSRAALLFTRGSSGAVNSRSAIVLSVPVAQAFGVLRWPPCSCGPVADFGQAANQPVPSDHCLPAGEACLAAGVDHHGADIGPAGIGNDAGGHIRYRPIGHDLEQSLELAVFGGEL